jgi:hypothetical protein
MSYIAQHKATAFVRIALAWKFYLVIVHSSMEILCMRFGMASLLTTN